MYRIWEGEYIHKKVEDKPSEEKDYGILDLDVVNKKKEDMKKVDNFDDYENDKE
ncbi:MAG: hypothetical protein WCS51_01285 [Bacilli bacterium]|jgi:hypothetical protein